LAPFSPLVARLIGEIYANFRGYPEMIVFEQRTCCLINEHFDCQTAGNVIILFSMMKSGFHQGRAREMVDLCHVAQLKCNGSVRLEAMTGASLI
jgi:hypothetical protein